MLTGCQGMRSDLVMAVTGPNDPSTQTLSALLARYPDACLRNFDVSTLADRSHFGALPNNRILSALLLTLGSPTVSASAFRAEIHRVTIADDEFLPPQ